MFPPCWVSPALLLPGVWRVRPAISPAQCSRVILTTRPRRSCSRRPLPPSRLGRGRMLLAQSTWHLQEMLQVSAKGVDDHIERKREAAHGLDRVTRFQGENAI